MFSFFETSITTRFHELLSTYFINIRLKLFEVSQRHLAKNMYRSHFWIASFVLFLFSDILSATTNISFTNISGALFNDLFFSSFAHWVLTSYNMNELLGEAFKTSNINSESAKAQNKMKLIHKHFIEIELILASK